jgi:hypothetical protein
MNTLASLFAYWPPHHHAYGIQMDVVDLEHVRQYIPKNISYIYSESYETFTISDARTIKSLQSEVTDQGAIFILHCSAINHEAQNALLKVLEEPGSSTYFFIIHPQVKQLLPTLQSRLEIVNLRNQEPDHSINQQVVDFVSLPLHARFDFIKKETDTKKKTALFTRPYTRRFLALLAMYVKKHIPRHNQPEILTTIVDAQQYLTKKGSSIKMILDMVAVYLPTD